MIRELFETDCEVFFAFNGTAANSLALAALCQSYHSILCHETRPYRNRRMRRPGILFQRHQAAAFARANRESWSRRGVRACGQAPFGCPLSETPGAQRHPIDRDWERSIRTEELGRLGETARRAGTCLPHGRRALRQCRGQPERRAQGRSHWQCGVDVLCFGGTKMGIAVGEAIVFFRKDLAKEFEYRCKQAGQLSSKMRFLAAALDRHVAERCLAAPCPPGPMPARRRLSQGLLKLDRIAAHGAPPRPMPYSPTLAGRVLAYLKNRGWNFLYLHRIGRRTLHVRAHDAWTASWMPRCGIIWSGAICRTGAPRR